MRRGNISRGKMAIMAAALAVGISVIFVYLGIEAARDMDISIHDSKVVSKDEEHTEYETIIQFRNTSFLPISIGHTIYYINIDGEKLGMGTIKSFVVESYGTKFVNSDFMADNVVLDRYGGEIPYERAQLTGTSNYNLYLTTYDVSFIHNPTEEQVEQFYN